MENQWFSRLWERHSTSLEDISLEDFISLVRLKAKEIITEDELKEKLSGDKKLRIKYGIDPTGAEVHLGHAVPIMMLRLFQRRGHDVHFIIGDFTAMIGDPSGRTTKRVPLTQNDIKANMKTYEKQISTLIDLKKTHTHTNSRWLENKDLTDFIKTVGGINMSAISQREDFRERTKAGEGVSLGEALYGSLMGIDSLEVEADIEIGGTDQLLNFMQTREIMSLSGVSPETILTTALLEGTTGDGRKMSKSFGNYIALHDTPENQFGLIMSIPDNLLKSYYIAFADVYEKDLIELEAWINQNPLEAKKQLGMLLVSILHGEKKALKAREDFERRFSQRAYTEEDEKIVPVILPKELLEGLCEAFGEELSKSKIRALIEQGGVKKISQDGTVSTFRHPTDRIEEETLVKVGKIHLFRFKGK